MCAEGSNLEQAPGGCGRRGDFAFRGLRRFRGWVSSFLHSHPRLRLDKVWGPPSMAPPIKAPSKLPAHRSACTVFGFAAGASHTRKSTFHWLSGCDLSVVFWVEIPTVQGIERLLDGGSWWASAWKATNLKRPCVALSALPARGAAADRRKPHGQQHAQATWLIFTAEVELGQYEDHSKPRRWPLTGCCRFPDPGSHGGACLQVARTPSQARLLRQLQTGAVGKPRICLCTNLNRNGRAWRHKLLGQLDRSVSCHLLLLHVTGRYWHELCQARSSFDIST